MSDLPSLVKFALEHGLMPQLDRWVVHRITKWIRSALAIKPKWPVPQNNINLARDTLYDPGFAEFTRRHIQTAKLPDAALSFEIAWDNALTHAEALRNLATQVRPIGCRFTISDFWGGKKSFELLRSMGPDFLKIRPSLWTNIDRSPTEFEKVNATIKECQEIGIKTIAERVESAEVLDQLERMGVDFAQGFGILPPQPLT